MKTISSKFDIWHWVPSLGSSSGILFGCDSSKFTYLSHSTHRFALDIHVENKLDHKQWQVTVVYGPVDRRLKKDLWKILDGIRGSSNKL